MHACKVAVRVTLQTVKNHTHSLYLSISLSITHTPTPSPPPITARAGQAAALAALLDAGARPWLPDAEGLSALDYARVRNRKVPPSINIRRLIYLPF